MATMAQASTTLKSWIRERALPFWSAEGVDADNKRFEERLTLEGSPILDVPIRLMSQARQIYVFALASRRGWFAPGRSLVNDAYAAMVRDFHLADGAEGWVHSIHRSGVVADPKRDLYGHAFALLAIASYVQTTGDRSELARADATLRFIDERMASPHGGFVDCLPRVDGMRRQNPHMHLFEALLALWDCSAREEYLARASRLFQLFASRFFQSSHGVLAEQFTETLEPCQAAANIVVEPGHHYEWVWLLRRFEAATGRSVSGYIDALYTHADQFGYDKKGLIVDELLADGLVLRSSRRAWPVTEAIKANVMEARHHRQGAAGKAAMLASALSEYFLLPSGGWIDRLDAEGNPSVEFMPASTFYHVTCAIDELDRLASP